MQATATAGKWLLDKKDLIKGALMAVISAVLTTVYSAVETGGLETINWSAVLKVAVVTGLGYLIKNAFTPQQIVITNPTKKAIEVAKEDAPVDIVKK